MAGPFNLSFGTSVVKRENKPIDDVAQKLVSDGWEKTGSVASGRVQYFEKSGIGITAIDGPLGTVIVPSGPVRGSVFGDEAVSFGKTSSIGAGAKAPKEESNVRTKRSSNTLT